MLLALSLGKHLGMKPKDLGLGADNWNSRDTPGLIILACGLFFAVAFAATWVWMALHVNSGTPGEPTEESVWELGYLSLSAALSEELLYRAIPLAFLNLQDSRAKWVYFLAVPGIFAAAHWAQGALGAVAAFLMGFVAACLYAASRNLWPNVVGHFAVDFCPHV